MYNNIMEVIKIVENYTGLPKADKDLDKPLRVALSGHPSDSFNQRYFYASETECREYGDETIAYVTPTDGLEKLYAVLLDMAYTAHQLFLYDKVENQ